MKNYEREQPSSSVFPANTKKEENTLTAAEILHALMNQLTSVLCCAELLVQQIQDPLLKEGGNRLMSAAQKAAELVNRLHPLFHSGLNQDEKK